MPAPASEPLSPWRTFWTSPVITMHSLLKRRDYDAWVTPLLLGGGLMSALSPQVQAELSRNLPEASNVLLVSLLLGVVVGALQAWLWPLLLHAAAKLLGGVGEWRSARLAAAWSSLPLLLGYVVAPLAMRGGDDWLGAFSALNLLLSVWATLLLCFSLATGYRLTPGKGALGTLLGGVFGLGLLVLLAVVLALVLVALGVTPPSVDRL